MKENNEAFTIARYSPGIYKTKAVLFLKQCLDSETFDRLIRSRNFRKNPVVGAKIYLSRDDWNKYVWIEQHGSLDGFADKNAPDTGQKNQSTKIISFIEEETKMKAELEKYIADLSPELQEKARECKTMEELQTMLAENDVELSEDALEAVAGGCTSKPKCKKCGGEMKWNSLREWAGWYCPKCD